VIALCSRSGSAKDISKAHGATRGALYTWKPKPPGKEIPMARSKKTPEAVPNDIHQLVSEIAQLKEQVQRLRLEKHILEAAAALKKNDPGFDLDELSNRG
jgi:transposase-like protein